MKLNGLEQYFKTDENGEIVDFTQLNDSGMTTLIYALLHNKSENLTLTEVQWDFLLKNSYLKQVDEAGWSPLMCALRNNKSQNLHLSQEQFEYLIKNSDLKQVTISGSSPLMFALKNNKEEQLNLTNEQWKYFIHNSDLSLITEKEHLTELKKIQSELLNDEILNKINIKENKNKSYKI